MADEPKGGQGLLDAFLSEDDGGDLLSAFLNEPDKAARPVSEAVSAEGYMGLKLGESKPAIEEERGATSKGTEVFGESALNLPEGRARAAQAVASGFIDYAKLNFPEIPFFGRDPTKGDFEKLAKRDLRFALLWDDLKTRQEESRDIAKQLHGDAPDWNDIQGRTTKALIEDALASGRLKPRQVKPKKAEPMAKEPRIEPLVLLQGGKAATPTKKPLGMDLMEDSDFDQAVAGFSKEAREGPPGVTREPLTDEEILSAAWGYLHERASDEMQTLDPLARSALRGAGKGVQLAGAIAPAGRVARAAGGVGARLAPLIEGAMASAGGQALAVGSGAQKEFSVPEVIAAAALMNMGGKAGSWLAARYPNAQKTMQTIGTLGTLQAGGTALEAATTGKVESVERLRQSSTPLRDALGILVESGTELAVGGALGAAESGRPRGKAAEAAAARKGQLAEKQAKQAHYTEVTAESMWPNSPLRKLAGIDKKVSDEILPREVAASKAFQDYGEALDTAAAGDPAKRKALADAAILHIESDGKHPLPQGVPEQVAREVVAKARAFGEAHLSFGEVLKNHNIIVPEARFREVTPEVKNRFTGLSDEEVVKDFLKSGSDDAVSEISRRVSSAPDAEVAKSALTSAMNKLVPDDAVTRSYIEGAIEKGVSFSGSDTGRFGARPGQTEPEDLVVMKKDFDRGYVDLKDKAGNIIGRKEVNRKDAKAGKYGKLVGSYDFAKKRGFFFPMIEELETKLAEIEREGKPPPQARGRLRKPTPTGLAEAHGKRRTTTFEEAFLSRKLDTSPESAMKVLSAEAGVLRKKAFLDIASEDGMILRPEQLPDAELRAAAAIEASGLKTREEALLKDIKRYQGEARLQARIELNAIRNQLAENKKIATGNFFKKAVGKDWGDYEGMYMHPAVMKQAEMFVKPTSGLGYLNLALSHMVKGMRVATSPRRLFTDLVGNLQKLDEMGMPVSVSDYAKSWLSEFGRRKKDTIDLEFDAIAKGHALGGQTATTTADERRLARITEARREAIERGAPQTGYNLAIATEAPAILSRMAERIPIPVAGKVLSAPYKAVQHFKRFISGTVDIAVFRAAYRNLREHGIDGSGPLSPAEAFDRLGDYADYNKNPKAVRALANYLSFLQYPSKVVQSLKQTLQRQPRVLGINITPMLDAIIASNPGSKPAQAALIGRGLIRLATASAKWMVPVAAIAHSRASALGITDKQMDEYIEDNYGYLPDVAKYLTRQMFIPTGRTPTGGIDGIDASSMFPAMYVMRYLAINFDSRYESDVGSVMRQIAGKNVLLSPIAAAFAASDQSGRPLDKRRGHEFEHGGRYWPLIESISPAFVMNPLNAYFRQQNIPESERNALMQIVKESTGLPMTVLRDKNFVQSTMEKWFQDGVVDIERRDDGSWNYYVRNPMTPEGEFAQWFIGTMSREMPDLFKMQMKMQRDMTMLKEAVGQ